MLYYIIITKIVIIKNLQMFFKLSYNKFSRYPVAQNLSYIIIKSVTQNSNLFFMCVCACSNFLNLK